MKSTSFGLAAVVVMASVMSGCTADDDPAPTSTPNVVTPSATSNASPTPDDGEAQDAVLEAYEAYWAAVVEAQRGNPDPALFEGVASGPLVEEAVAQARQFQELGIVREGAPAFSAVKVDIEGTEATVVACVDNSEWVVPGVEDDLADVLPGGVVLEERDGTWLVVDTRRPPDAFTC